MPTPTPEDFWKLVAASRLVEPDMVADLRREHAEQTAEAPSAASADATTTSIAKWLVVRGVLSKWQGRRLLNGDSGPFFIGDYRLLERLENDGPGRLYRVRHEPSGRRVCLMVLDRKLCQRVDIWTEIMRRTTLAHDAVDPVLSRTWALEQVAGNRFIVCEDVEGSSLADELARVGPLPPADACRLMLPIFAAVAELHRRGGVHGSLSLDALRREPAAAASGADDRSGRVRLLQLPLAGDPHTVPAQTPIDATERISGLGRRASFVAPELMLPGRVADQRSDVYALGCMLHSLLTGVPPCWQGDAQSTLSQAAFVGPPPLGPPQVPVEVATLVAFLVAREPASRYPDAAEAADALSGCIGMPPVSGGLPPAQATAGGQFTPPSSHGSLPAYGPNVNGPNPSAATASSSIERATIAARKRAARLRSISMGIAGGLVALTVAIALSRSNRRPPGIKHAADDHAVASAEDDNEIQTETKNETKRGANAPEKPATDADRTPTEPVSSGPRLSVVDSTDLPWASPTAGKPPSLSYLPPGSQLILLARPEKIVADEEGRQFVRSLGPRAADAMSTLEILCGRELKDIADVQGSWQAGGGDAAAATGDVISGWTIRLLKPSPLTDDPDARLKAWGKTTTKAVAGETIYKAAKLSFWLPEAEGGNVLVIAPAALLQATVEASKVDGRKADDDALAVSLTQDLEQLVGMLDRTRHLTVLGSPHYLLHDGRPLLAGPLAGLVEPLAKFLGDGLQAAALSLHFADNFYAEVDAIATRGEQAKALADRLARQIDDVADAVEDACAAIDPHPYGKKLVMRLPTMIRVVAANARCGVEGKGVVLNAYLPRHAGHNLVLASELALEQSPGVGGRGASPRQMSPVAEAGPAGGLEKRISLVFAKDTLEKSIQMVSEEIGMPMEILGTDLQLEGITKNQSFELNERDSPAEAVLRSILKKSDPAGRLVYVVRDRGGVATIEITTKAAAAKRGDTLPPGF